MTCHHRYRCHFRTDMQKLQAYRPISCPGRYCFACRFKHTCKASVSLCHRAFPSESAQACNFINLSRWMNVLNQPVKKAKLFAAVLRRIRLFFHASVNVKCESLQESAVGGQENGKIIQFFKRLGIKESKKTTMLCTQWTRTDDTTELIQKHLSINE